MKIALLGYGKMGKTIERLALAAGHEIVLCVDADNRPNLTTQQLQLADVVIEFSQPTSAVDNIKLCVTAGVPVVCGTTGWYEHFDEVTAYVAEHKGTLLYATNFSIGVNLLFALNEQLAKWMNTRPEYNVLLKEIHHIHKLDHPSGTALTLLGQLTNNIVRKTAWSESPTPAVNEIQVLAEREGEVPGTHIVTYTSTIDTLEISHVAHSREGFAGGAIAAAVWVHGKTGVFTMKDVLSF